MAFMNFYVYCIIKLGSICYFLVYRKFAPRKRGDLEIIV